MRYTIDSNGNLTFYMEEADRYDLETIRDRTSNEHLQLTEILDQFGYSGNSVFESITPAEIAALTDAPMLTDNLEFKDDGSRVVKGKVWWFPAYESTSFMDWLLSKGNVTFTAA